MGGKEAEPRADLQPDFPAGTLDSSLNPKKVSSVKDLSEGSDSDKTFVRIVPFGVKRGIGQLPKVLGQTAAERQRPCAYN